MKSEWCCSYFNKTYLELDTKISFYINDNNKIPDIIKTCDINKNMIFSNVFNKFKTNKYGLTNNYNCFDFNKNIENIRINSDQYKNLVVKKSSIEEVE